jgi:hypothetical protein
LAAILAADIAGYSTLMGADEGATVREVPNPDIGGIGAATKLPL